MSSDVWSLGLSMIEMALGHYPYPPETYANVFAQLTAIVDGDPPELPEHFSGTAKDFVARCLHKFPDRRATYAELLVRRDPISALWTRFAVLMRPCCARRDTRSWSRTRAARSTCPAGSKRLSPRATRASASRSKPRRAPCRKPPAGRAGASPTYLWQQHGPHVHVHARCPGLPPSRSPATERRSFTPLAFPLPCPTSTRPRRSEPATGPQLASPYSFSPPAGHSPRFTPGHRTRLGAIAISSGVGGGRLP